MTNTLDPSVGGPDSIQSILVLRKLTRAVADAVRAQMMDYLATLMPLLRPKTVLGDYIQGGTKESARRADKAFKELQALYETVATAKPFNLPRELKPPIDIGSATLEVTPLDYAHVAQVNGDSRTITVRSPLTWVLTYSGFAPSRFRELLEAKSRANDDVQRFLLSYLVVHIVTSNQPGVMQMLETLHFPVTTSRAPGFGDLPITRIGAPIATTRASDDVVVRSAELTGVDAFEEVVRVEDIAALRDPMKERLVEIVRTHAPELAPVNL